MSYSSRMNVSSDPQSHEQEEASYLEQTCQSAEQCIQNYPTAALVVTFGAAFALGYMLSGLMVEREPQRGRIAEFGHKTAEMGQKTWEALAKMMPEAIAQRMHG